MKTITVYSKGRIAIPKRLREELDIRPGDRLKVRREADRLVIQHLGRPEGARDWRSWRGALAGTGALADHLREHGEQV